MYRIVYEDHQLLESVAQRCGLTKIKDVAIPFPSAEVEKRNLVGKDILVRVRAPFTVKRLVVEMSDEQGTLLFSFGGQDLHAKSRLKWAALAAYLSLMAEQVEQDASDE